jgi:rhamnosyltransferase
VVHVSVVIITKNQRGFLERSLPAIARQQGVPPGQTEVIVVDSGSTDGAQDVVRAVASAAARVRLVEIPAATFGYARAHNAGAARARGEFLVRLSGDAVPAGDHWLRSLLAPFEDDGVAATWGSQILPPGIRNPLERYAQRLCYGTARAPRRFTRDVTVLGCNMAVRRTLWRRHPYDERLPQAEDYAWMHHWYRCGYAGVFVPGAAVVHGHDEPLARALHRSLAQSALQCLIRTGVWEQYRRRRVDTPRRSC